MTGLHDILLRFDEIGAWERPEAMNYDVLRQSVLRVQNGLNKRFGLQFLLDDQVQDASFGFDLKLPKEIYQQPSPSQMKKKFGLVADINCAVRFSNFGRLATICFEEQCTEGAPGGIKEELSAEGFIYLPASDLDIDYDGRFEEFKKVLGNESIPTWWIRYFDYI